MTSRSKIDELCQAALKTMETGTITEVSPPSPTVYASAPEMREAPKAEMTLPTGSGSATPMPE